MTYDEFIEKYHIRLSPAQKEAVITTDGPVCVEASPGAGKTTTLIARLGYMIFVRGIHPENILTMTYTVAATNDMKSRFVKFFGPEYESRVEFRTINGVCERILKDYARLYGKNLFRLLDSEKEKNAILAEQYQKNTGDFAVESDLKQLSTYITLAKNSLLKDEAIAALSDDEEFPVLQIYNGYQKELKSRQAYDYDDQLIYAYKLLSKDPELLSRFQNKYPYINVDESQDSSIVQHRILDLVAAKTKNLFMVGDLDQSIYGFRGAAPDELLRFEERFPGAKIIYMEDNYRSDGKIIELADSFVQKNKFRRKKHVLATRAACNEVEFVELPNRADQYAWLLENAIEPSAKQGRETAILYNENESAIPIIDLLERKGFPYNLKKSDGNFFKTRIVTDALNFIRFTLDPKNTDLFMQIYSKMGLYLKRPQAIAACDYAISHDLPVLDAVRHIPDISEYTTSACREAYALLTRMAGKSAGFAFQQIIEGLKYEEYLQMRHMGTGKLFTLNALIKNCSTLDAFLQRIEQLTSIVTEHGNTGSNLTLSTIHSSKGLEYDTVYLIDVVDGNLPEKTKTPGFPMSPEDQNVYEEDRRKFYVGITRAKNHLYLLSYADKPSAFIRECKGPVRDDYYEKKPTGSYLKRSPKREDISLKELKDYVAKFGIIGKRIEHRTWGLGTVTDVNTDTFSVDFDNGFSKKLCFKVCLAAGAIREAD